MVVKCGICGKDNVYSIRKGPVKVLSLCGFCFEKIVDVKKLEELKNRDDMRRLKAALNGQI